MRVRDQYKKWISDKDLAEDMTAECLKRLYDVMTEMEAVIDDPEVESVPVDQVEKWFRFIQFAIVKELTGKDAVVTVREEELKNAIEKRLLASHNKEEHQGDD